MDYNAIHEKAHTAAVRAAEAHVPTPMGVIGPDTTYHVPEGVCGFAWVTVKPGNSKFANWLKKNGLARKAYGGGVRIWVSEFGQSMERKQIYASKLANMLKEAGVAKTIYSDSRMD